MFAVVRTGGKQYRVTDGETLRVEKLPGEVGEKVELSDILLVAAGEADVRIGRPLVAGARVTAEIVEQGRARKVLIFKYKRRKRYRRKRGHRQSFTAIKITSITA
ncbi:MAG: 50S ribosomal protein L21 [Myxococcota bacterium]